MNIQRTAEGTGLCKKGLMIISSMPIVYSNFIFLKYLETMGYEQVDIYIDCVINYYPYDEHSPNFQAILTKRVKEIKEKVLELRPKNIICLGEQACKTFSKKLWRNPRPRKLDVKWKDIVINMIVSDYPTRETEDLKILELII